MTCSQHVRSRTQPWEKPNARANLALCRNCFFKACSVKVDSPFEEFIELSVQKKHVSRNQVQSVWRFLFHRRISVVFADFQNDSGVLWSSSMAVSSMFYILHTKNLPNAIYHIHSSGFSWKAVDCFYFILLPTLDYIDCRTIVCKFHSYKEFCHLENLSWSSNYPCAVKHL